MTLVKILNKKLEEVRKMDILEANRKLILDHDKELGAKGRSPIVRLHFLRILSEIAQKCKNRPFKTDKPYMKDIILDYATETKKKYKDTTQMLYLVKLKQAFRWFYGMKKGSYPPCVDWIEVRTVDKDYTDREVLTWEDVFMLSKSADNPRDAAIVLFLFETGARINEVTSMKISDIKIIDSQHAIVRLKNSKRGMSKKYRQIDVSRCVQHLKAWKDVHAEKENPDALFWQNMAWGYSKEAELSNPGMIYILKKLADRAKVTKHVNPHWFRHSSATFFGQYYNEMQLRDRFGWSKISKMPSKYCHESGESRKFMEVSGIKEAKKDKPINSPELPVCRTCGTYITEIRGKIPEICPRCNNPWNRKTNTEELNREITELKSELEKTKKDFLRIVEEKLGEIQGFGPSHQADLALEEIKKAAGK